jgi:large subunit ribosomal protein L16
MPLLLPKRIKYRKAFRGKRRGASKGGTRLAFGEFGLKALDNGWVTAAQIEACRVAITRILFEADGIPEMLAKETFRLAASKLPLPTRLVNRKDEGGG